ncbi:tRNA uridine-5-carboxymethylaminomethyl(34) synthesis GTPase MnmE [Lichenicola cladoniae]|uniref:tRNA modification GTPase MnmE n=1 Tax=Lichenicola cladoniae TaxID=1484109 RepID=A0A6M8HV74_9PROT|nr:tRNA uridine-5-carboxymethylaminomethyl(34) synthesis GTPase MnmE [Lichenicola cladoniae]NPD69376.1 tRNA uridine-5-carboxymethylaminomethyl(34) synthesis GTPase MnmE [Acetobacteraceae bacterium]QKE92238.1 tRNA uridine-5-carboxymethylaminomethyl(34) synthesis GTPase MnmE [Lichenicola cladoniae]
MIDGDATIFARATGSGRAAIAVIRISGASSGHILKRLAGDVPAPRRAVVRALHASAHGGDLLDRALVLWFPGPGSYTGEDSAELHLHAGPAVIEAVSDALVALGARPAEPGEFTRRAFSNGRLDLLEAEGIADLIEAETQSQRRQALRQADGALSRLYHGWAERLRYLLAHQEALIDFPDEDLPPEIEAGLVSDLGRLLDDMLAHLAQGEQAQRIRSGLVVAVVGPPNVGKSSLVNRLAGRDAAMVSEWAGTTRDAIEVRLMLGGVPVTLVDTAGLRETLDPLEAEGVRRARLHASHADLVIEVAAGTLPADAGTSRLQVWNKVDLAQAPAGWIGVSAKTGDGIDRLEAELIREVVRLTDTGVAPPMTRARHRAGIDEAVGHLQAAQQLALPELRGEASRLAMQALGRLTGAIGVEDLLDSVFGQFCIGK